MKPGSLEGYIEQADDLAQEIVNAWGISLNAGNAARLTTDFKALFDLACQYRKARETADNHRESEQDAKIEKLTRESFAIAYKYYSEKHALMF
jgi:hypothetical protein